jgi:hypothetical protein
VLKNVWRWWKETVEDATESRSKYSAIMYFIVVGNYHKYITNLNQLIAHLEGRKILMKFVGEL